MSKKKPAGKPARKPTPKTAVRRKPPAKPARTSAKAPPRKTAAPPRLPGLTAGPNEFRNGRQAPPVPDRSTQSPADLTPLTPDEIEGFRGMLLEKRRELAGDVGGLQEEALSTNRHDASGNLSTMPMHMADLGTDNFERELTLGLIEGERVLLREIDEALERINRGTYGICQATGKPIGKARLRATPWTKYCYEYMLAQERRQTRGF